MASDNRPRSRTVQHRPLATALIAAATTLALTACGSGADSSSEPGGGGFAAEPAQGGTVHVLQNADFSYLDPARGFDGGVNNFYRLVYRQLTTSAPGSAEDPNEIVPDLATGLGEVSDDGLTWTYRLKDDLKFADGAPITSAEVKFGISRAWDPEIGIGSPYLKQVIDAPKDYSGPYESGDLPTIETPDEQTVVFHLKEPFPEFDAVLAQMNATPFPEGTGEGDEFIHEIIASGPYQLAEYVPGSTIKLERNPSWDPETDDVRAAKPDAWEFTIGLDPATIDERLIAGQGADVNALAGTVQPATLPRLQTPQLKERTLVLPGVCTTYMGLNTTKKPLDDVRVRQAISYAIDRTSIVNASGGTQLGAPSTTILPQTVAGHKDFDLYPSDDGTGDVEAAQQLLDDSGLSDGFTLTLDIRSQESMQAQAEAVQQALERVGITVELNLIDTATYYETIGTPSQQHDAAITGWCPDWASSAATFIPPLFDGRTIYEKGNSNLAQLDDPDVNQQIDTIKAMTDIDAANEQWGDLDEQILELAPVVPLMVATTVSLPGENLTGLHSSANVATGGIDYVGVGLKDPAKG